ncbi:hypothetical protein ZTR_03631 [Talaromyces verruculosus]|nr:hypothetical protein ZTR_03631 [Talaromyces verruculosus]
MKSTKFGMLLKVLLLGASVSQVDAVQSKESDTELYRPQYHYTPAQNWMNDPNGLVLDHGITWTTYDDGKPIILDPPSLYQYQYLDFPDPNIFWHQPIERWVAVISLVKVHKLLIYTSLNLKQWNLESPYGDSDVPPFNISYSYINLVGGGDTINQTAIRLQIDGSMVHTTTGPNSGQLTWQSWDVSAFQNQSAVIEIIDLATGGWGHINVDEISFANSPATNNNANWLDWGPDFYAAQGYNGLSQYQQMIISWMNNWQYGAAIPTSPWHSAMTIPRQLLLKTIDQRTVEVQEPEERWKASSQGNESTGHSVDVVEPEAANGSSEFGIIVRASEDFSRQTRIGYDFATQQVFIDRTKSGDVSFDSTFPSVYYAPISLALNNTVALHIFVDWSSVEVFDGQGETTLTTQIFPPENATYGQLFSNGGSTNNVQIRISKVHSTWT